MLYISFNLLNYTEIIYIEIFISVSVLCFEVEGTDRGSVKCIDV